MTNHSPDTTVAGSAAATPDRVYRNAFRVKRFAAFLALADAVLARKGTCRILDLGGEIAYWEGLGDLWRPRRFEITLINTTPAATSPDGTFTTLQGDARRLPHFADGSFDIVHSNSVIEHVGGWTDMRAMAAEVRRLAPAYYVQTPNFWFPLEPHMRVPFIHWLPRPWRRRLVSARACGFYPKAGSIDAAYRILEDARLIDAAEMRELFPDAEITNEKVGPLTKSFVAVRRAR